jgi:hypothetical protein
MVKVTNETRDTLDERIRKRIHEEFLDKICALDAKADKADRPASAIFGSLFANDCKAALPVSAILHERGNLGFRADLGNACPFYRQCDCPYPNQCLPHPRYRECQSYKGRLAHEVMNGQVSLPLLGRRR